MKRIQWLIKDFDGEYILVVAEKCVCSGNGLCFYLNDVKIAHFLKWSSYRKLI